MHHQWGKTRTKILDVAATQDWPFPHSMAMQIQNFSQKGFTKEIYIHVLFISDNNKLRRKWVVSINRSINLP